MTKASHSVGGAPRRAKAPVFVGAAREPFGAPSPLAPRMNQATLDAAPSDRAALFRLATLGVESGVLASGVGMLRARVSRRASARRQDVR